MNHLTFLEGRKYTKRCDLVKRIADQIDNNANNEGISHIKAITDYIASLHNDVSRKEKEYRKRTAAEILFTGYQNGCTDRALSFIVLSRELGIPTRYVETLQEEWLKNKDFSGKIQGHVFTDVFFDNQWVIYDPLSGFSEAYAIEERGDYVVIGKGLDFSELYVPGRKIPISIGSIDSLREIAKKISF